MRPTQHRLACLAVSVGPISLAPAHGQELFRLLPDIGYDALQFGESVALNGGLALIAGEGIFTTPIPGGAFLFDATTGTLLSDFPQPTLPGDAGPTDSRFYGVALSDPIPLPDGDIAPVALVGTTTIEFRFSYPCVVRAYHVGDPGNPELLWNLTPDDAQLNDEFGEAMAIDGALALIGTPASNNNGGFTGAAYLFDLTTGQQLAKLLAADGEAGDQFGFSVDMDGGLAVIGARRDNNAAIDAGAAYVFDVSDPTAPVELAKLTPDNGDSQDFFGYSVAIEGSTAVVGAIFDDDAAFAAGAAYIYDLTDPADPVLAKKLTTPDARNNDDFGWAVAMERRGDRVAALIGARTDDDAGPGNGAAYLFDVTTPSDPIFVKEFLPSTVTNVDTFGWAVDLDDGVALVGSPGADDQGSSSGTAYLIATPLPPSPCNPADLSPTLGVLDLADIDTFIAAFIAGDPAADLVDTFGVLDLADIDAFITAFLAGCP